MKSDFSNEKSDFINYTDYYKWAVKQGLRKPLEAFICFTCGSISMWAMEQHKEKEKGICASYILASSLHHSMSFDY